MEEDYEKVSKVIKEQGYTPVNVVKQVKENPELWMELMTRPDQSRKVFFYDESDYVFIVKNGANETRLVSTDYSEPQYHRIIQSLVKGPERICVVCYREVQSVSGCPCCMKGTEDSGYVCNNCQAITCSQCLDHITHATQSNFVEHDDYVEWEILCPTCRTSLYEARLEI